GRSGWVGDRAESVAVDARDGRPPRGRRSAEEGAGDVVGDEVRILEGTEMPEMIEFAELTMGEHLRGEAAEVGRAGGRVTPSDGEHDGDVDVGHVGGEGFGGGLERGGLVLGAAAEAHGSLGIVDESVLDVVPEGVGAKDAERGTAGEAVKGRLRGGAGGSASAGRRGRGGGV